MTESKHSKILIAYFSRTGEQYSVGNITEGNTAIIAKIIADKTGGDLFEIKVAQDNFRKAIPN
jgi:flavodoxin